MQSLDLELSIEALDKQRKQEHERKTKDLKARLLKLKMQVKHELATNEDLNEKVSTLTVREFEQAKLLKDLDTETHSINAKLTDYEQSTRLKEDHTKLQRAYQ